MSFRVATCKMQAVTAVGRGDGQDTKGIKRWKGTTSHSHGKGERTIYVSACGYIYGPVRRARATRDRHSDSNRLSYSGGIW